MKKFIATVIAIAAILLVAGPPGDRTAGGGPGVLEGRLGSAATYSYTQMRDAVGTVAGQGMELPARLKDASARFEMAAMRGLSDAQYKLSLAYRDARLFEHAYAWAEVASRNGHRMSQALVDSLSAQMSGPQLDRAKALAKDWGEAVQPGPVPAP